MSLQEMIQNASLPSPPVAALLAFTLIWTLWVRSRQTDGQPPFVWSLVPWFGNVFNFRNRPELWLIKTSARVGPIFRTTLLGKQPIFCVSRNVISQIYKNYTDFSFTPIKSDAHHRIFGVSNLAVSDDEGQKKMFAELYRLLAKRSFGPMVGHISSNMETRFLAFRDSFSPEELKNGKTIDLMQLIPPLFYGASSQGMFGNEFPGDHIFTSNTDFEDQFALMYAGLPFPWLVKRGVTGRDRCIALVKDSIRQYESGEAQAPYFIQAMLDLRTTLNWSSQDLAAYLHSYLFALTSNTIYAAYWLTVYTYSHPSIIADLRAEIDKAMQDFLTENPSEKPSAMFANLGFMDSQFPLLNSMINETLRLCSNGTSVRKVINDVVLQVPLSDYAGHSGPSKGSRDVLFKKGDFIYMPNRYFHLNPDEFVDPEAFDPKRFTEDKTSNSSRPGTFLPFGGGTSVCSGRFLANAELRALIIILLRHFDVSYVGVVDANGNLTKEGQNQPHGHPVPPYQDGSGSAILHPTGDMRVSFKPRK